MCVRLKIGIISPSGLIKRIKRNVNFGSMKKSGAPQMIFIRNQCNCTGQPAHCMPSCKCAQPSLRDPFLTP